MDGTSNQLRLPESIDKYRPIEILGYGGYGVVYLADDPEAGRKVALKVPFDWVMSDEKLRKSFRNEVTKSAKLNHTNIVPIYDVDSKHTPPFFTMPFCEGGNLASHLEHGKLGFGIERFDKVIEIVNQIAAALAYTHAQGVVHRDVKPGNILNHCGRWMVSDFGAARSAVPTNSVSTTSSGMAIPYASPEVLSGMDPDCKDDVYSLACVAFEILTDRRPYTATTFAELITEICDLSDPPPNAHDVNSKIPLSASKVIARGMAKRSKERIGSTALFAKQLQEALIVVPEIVRTVPAPGLQQAARTSANLTRLKPHLIVTSSVVLAALVIFLTSYRASWRLVQQGDAAYFGQHGQDIDLVGAAQFYRTAAEAGDPKGMVAWGYCLYNGLGTSPDSSLARLWFSRGAKSGDPMAMLWLASSFDEGTGGPADHAEAKALREKAEPLCIQAADDGDMEALFQAASSLVLAKSQLEKARHYLKHAANRGSPSAAEFLADCMAFGQLGKADPEGAFLWYKEARLGYERSAQAGSPYSRLALARMLSKGIGGPVDTIRANRWYMAARSDLERLANAGNMRAAVDLARGYDSGKWLARNEGEARRWAKIAASAGSLDGMFYYACLLESSSNVSTLDYPSARLWYQEAIKAGSNSAKNNYATLLRYGRGGSADVFTARKLYLEAAEAGNVFAMVNIGEMLYYGDGGPSNKALSSKWALKARDLAYATGNKAAIKRANDLLHPRPITHSHSFPYVIR